MQIKHYVRSLAGCTSSPIAQLLLLNRQDEEINLELVHNSHLTPEVWQALLPLTTKSTGRPTLISNAPTPELAKTILTEPLSIRIEALYYGIPNLDTDSLRTLLSPPLLDCEQAAGAITSAIAPPQMLPDLWELLNTAHEQILTPQGGYPTRFLVDSLALNYDLLTDQDFLEIVVGDRYSPVDVSHLLDYRPGLTKLLYEHQAADRFLCQIVRSRYLTPAQGEAIYNKVTSHRYQQATESPERNRKLVPFYIGKHPSLPYSLRAKALRWVTYRLSSDIYKTLPIEFNSGHLQQWAAEMDELAKQGAEPIQDWLNVAQDKKTDIYNAISFFGKSNYPTIESSPRFYTPYVDETRQRFLVGIPELDAAGAEAWDIFISLLDDWNDPLQELIQLAISTSVR